MSVTVEDGFVRVDGKSYAINKINSVEVRERKVRGKGGAIAFAVLAVIFVLGAFGAREGGGSPAGSLVAAALFGGLAWLLFRRPDVFEYKLFLMTSSSEAAAVTTNDQAVVASLRAEIEGAMLREARAGR